MNDTKAMHRVTECVWYVLASESEETRSAAVLGDLQPVFETGFGGVHCLQWEAPSDRLNI